MKENNSSLVYGCRTKEAGSRTLTHDPVGHRILAAIAWGVCAVPWKMTDVSFFYTLFLLIQYPIQWMIHLPRSFSFFTHWHRSARKPYFSAKKRLIKWGGGRCGGIVDRRQRSIWRQDGSFSINYEWDGTLPSRRWTDLFFILLQPRGKNAILFMAAAVLSVMFRFGMETIVNDKNNFT